MYTAFKKYENHWTKLRQINLKKSTENSRYIFDTRNFFLTCIVTLNFSLFPDSDVALSFGNWIAYNIAGATVLLVLAYIWLSAFYLGLGFVFGYLFTLKI